MALHQSVGSGGKVERAGSREASAAAKDAGGREIPDKLYFRIGEVAKLCEVAPYVLRFWESEFPQLKPNKGGTGQRLYRRRDVEMALRVKTLLYDEGYTIAGARQHLKSEARPKDSVPLAAIAASEAAPDAASSQKLQKLRAEMQSLIAMLSQPATARPKGAAVQSIRAAKSRPAVVAPQGTSLFDHLD